MSWSQEEAVKALMLACKRLGWQVLVPNVDDDEDVQGLVVGTKEFCDGFRSDEWETWETTDARNDDH